MKDGRTRTKDRERGTMERRNRARERGTGNDRTWVINHTPANLFFLFMNLFNTFTLPVKFYSGKFFINFSKFLFKHVRISNFRCLLKATQFHVDCKNLLEQTKATKNVTDQLTRASYSIPLNIAEGSGKFSKPDRKNYFTTARASVFECAAFLEILYVDKKISRVEFFELNDVCEQMSRMLLKRLKTCRGD